MKRCLGRPRKVGGGNSMGKRMRMTLPKKEEDLQKVVEEVMELHPEMAHEHEHEHLHAHDIDELMHTIDVLMDTVNSRLSDLEEKVDKLYEEVVSLYKLFSVVVRALAAGDGERVKLLEEAKKLLAEAKPAPQTG